MTLVAIEEKTTVAMPRWRHRWFSPANSRMHNVGALSSILHYGDMELTLTPSSPPVVWNPIAQEVGRLCQRIASLMRADAPDDGPPATIHAVRQAISLILECIPHLHSDQFVAYGAVAFPRGIACTDDAGGIRIEWMDDRHSVFLTIGAEAHSPSYIYYNANGVRGIDSTTSPENLARRLLMFPVA